MRFDRTYIAIRQRSIAEILDLSLHVIRDYSVPILVLLFAGAVPFVVINWLLIGWMADNFNSYDYAPLYVFLMACLVMSQSHVGTTFVTHYLGLAIFEERPSIAETIRRTFSCSPYFLWIHGCLRLAIPITIAPLFLRESVAESEGFYLTCTLIFFAGIIACLVRAMRPFATEILLLEKTPVSKANEHTVTYSIRSSSLHSQAGADLTGRFILVGLVVIPLVFSIYASLVLLDDMLNLHIDADATLVTWYWPIALWLVAGVSAVVRFLSYLDTRIRQEGWAVELRIRAEALRFAEAEEK